MKSSAVAFTCGASVGAAVLLLPFVAVLSHFVVDDSFYYLEIARNLALGNGPTFDGIHQTNGFQPLFQFALVPVYWLIDDRELAVYWVKGLEAALLGGICLTLFDLGKRLGGEKATGLMAVAFLLLPGPGGRPFGGDLFIAMESGANALFMILALSGLLGLLSNGQDWGLRRFIGLGLILGLLFLARVDNGLLIVGLLTLMASSVDRIRPSRMAVLLVATALTVGVYVVWNWITFGSVLPISGSLKLFYTQQHGRELWAVGPWAWLTAGLWFLFTPSAVAILPLGGLLWYPGLLLLDRVRTRLRPSLPEIVRQRRLLRMLWLTGVVKVLAYGFLLQLQSHRLGWYYVQEMIVIALSVGLIGRSLLGGLPPRTRTRLATVGLVLTAAGSTVRVLTVSPEFDWEAATYEAVPMIDAMTPDDAIIGAKDAGALGYFLPNPVVNLDGLVNDEAFFEVVRRGAYAEYVDQEGIAYMTNLLEPGAGDQDRFISWLGAERLELLYQSDRPASGTNGRVYKLYRVLVGGGRSTLGE